MICYLRKLCWISAEGLSHIWCL